MHAHDVIPESGGLRVAFYGRHSTSRQDIQMQISAAKRFCEHYRCHFTENMEYHDLGVSATKTPMQGRLGLVRLLDDIRDHKIDLVVAYSESRLARDPIEHAQIRLALEGVPVVLCDTETVYNPPHTDILAQMTRDAVSKFEVDQTAERTRDTAISRIKHGHRVGGRVPYGYTFVEDVKVERGGKKITRHYVVRPECEDEIREVYRRYGRGEGFSSIAGSMGWFKRDGETPNKERVKYIIINPFYAGYVSLYKVRPKSRLSVEPIEKWQYTRSEQIEPVISFDRWYQCFHLYEQKRNAKLPPRYYKTSFLLSGLLLCEHDEKTAMTEDPTPMVGENTLKRIKDQDGEVIRTNGKREYVCPTCNRHVNTVDVHHQVLQRFLRNHLVRTPADEVRLRTAVLTSISHEMASYQRAHNESERKQKTLEEQLSLALERVKGLFDLKEKERWLPLIDEFRTMQSREIDRQKDLRGTIKQRTELLQLVKSSPEYLTKIVRNNTLHERALRTLLLSMVKQVHYTADGKLKIVAWVGEL